MEHLSSVVWWIGLTLAILLVGILVRRNHARKREEAQIRADKSTILNVYNDMGYNDIQAYKDLPNYETRVKWLKHHYSEFMEAVERQHYASRVEEVIAAYLDFRILKGVTAYTSRERALSGYQYASYNISLNEHQEKLDAFNEEQARLAKIEAEHEAKRRAEREAEEKSRKEAAKSHWDSLSEEEKEAFKKAQGKSERQKALGSTVSTGYSADILYPLIMATEFSSINTNSNNSIDYCQSPSYTSYDSGSSYSSSDSSSSYSDSGSSSCDGGGGGGGE